MNTKKSTNLVAIQELRRKNQELLKQLPASSSYKSGDGFRWHVKSKHGL